MNTLQAMKKIKILLVDDHQIMLDGLEAFLERESDIEIAGMEKSGENALVYLDKNPVDLVVLDISMPNGIDGLETAKRMRRKFPNIRIILLTMMGEWKFVSKAFHIGINGYVIKEKSKESLVSGIRAVMSGHRYYPPDLPSPGPNDWDDDQDDVEVNLTKREREILCLMAKNPALSAREMGEILFISKATVERHIQNIKEKLNLHKNMELVKYAMDHKLCE